MHSASAPSFSRPNWAMSRRSPRSTGCMLSASTTTRRGGWLASRKRRRRLGIFFRAFRGIAGCRDNAGFTGWLFGIARFVIADVHRGRGRQHQPLGLTDDPEDPEPPPEEQFLRHERGQALRAARESCLASRERDLFDLLLADLTDREIATALGRPYGAIRTAHWRLLTKLRSCLTMQDAGKGGPHVVS